MFREIWHEIARFPARYAAFYSENLGCLIHNKQDALSHSYVKRELFLC